MRLRRAGGLRGALELNSIGTWMIDLAGFDLRRRENALDIEEDAVLHLAINKVANY